MTTQYGFDFGPMKVERAIGDPRYGYVVHVKVGRATFSIESSPKGRNVHVTTIVGNHWIPMEPVVTA